jgi:hypothetical protein
MRINKIKNAKCFICRLPIDGMEYAELGLTELVHTECYKTFSNNNIKGQK